MFITLLAYHVVHTIRYQLKQQGINLSWQSIRAVFSSQQRITISVPTKDKQTLFVRTTTRPETLQKKIYDALQFSSDMLGNVKTLME